MSHSKQHVEYADRTELSNFVGRKLIDLRKKQNLTQECCAYLAGIAKSHLSQLEAGKRIPSLRTLLRLGEVLNVGMYEFFKILEREPKENQVLESVEMLSF